MVLVDSGASHNFISHEIVVEIGIKPDSSLEYVVEVGDGHQVRKGGMCRDLQLALPNVNVVQNFYLFDLRGVDVVLGYEWLEWLGKMEADFREDILWVTIDGKIVEIRGDPQLSRTVASLKAMFKEFHKGGEGFDVKLNILNLCSQEVKGEVVGLSDMLEKYGDLF